MEIPDEKDQIQQALNRAYFYLKFRPRTEKEVTDYLAKKSERFRWPPAVIEKTITSLKDQNLINDDAFVEWFVNQRNVAKPKSAFALSHEMQRFGVRKDSISKFFDQNPVNEQDLAYNALRKRWPRFQYLEKKVRFQKAATFLSRRGFSFEVIKKAIQKIEEN